MIRIRCETGRERGGCEVTSLISSTNMNMTGLEGEGGLGLYKVGANCCTYPAERCCGHVVKLVRVSPR